MKAYKILVAAAAFAVTACDDFNDNFDGLDDMVKDAQSNVVSEKYELADADYEAIGKYKALDEADKDALAFVKSNKMFPTEELAHKYLPTFAANKYYTSDKGSAVVFSYKVSSSTPEYIVKLNAASAYELSSEDYASIWGNEKTKYLTPSTEAKAASVVDASSAADGDYVVVSYEYSDVEPSSSSGEDEPTVTTWQAVNGAAYPEKDGWSFNNVGDIDLSAYAGQKIRIGFRYTSDSEKAGTVEIKNLLVAKSGTNYHSTVYFAAQADGTYKSSTSVTEGKCLILAKAGDEYFAFGILKDPEKNYGYCVSDPVTVTDGVVSAADAASIFVELEKSGDNFRIKNATGKYMFMKDTYDSFNVSDEVGSEGYDWAVELSAAGVDFKNVLTGKTICYDAGYKSFGAYSDSKLGIYLKNSLLSSSVPEGFVTKDVVLPEGATYVWSNSDKYGAKASAYINKTNLESDSWYITSEIDLTEATVPYLTFDMAANFFKGSLADYFGIYVTTDYTDGSDFNIAGGTKSLKATVATSTKYAVFTSKNSAWSKPSNVLIVNPSDYKKMGLSNANFSSTYKPDAYLPTFVTQSLPYAQEGDRIGVVYHFYANKEVSVEAVEYTYADGAWSKSANEETVTGQFVKSSGWVFDPSLTLNFPHDRSDAAASAFYQAVTDWVWENIDVKNGFTTKGQGYVTSYGNNEYYTGSSAYQNDVDWRVSAAKAQGSGYDGKSDEEIFAQLQQNLISTYGKVLGVLYPDADVVDGVDVIYTINFVAYYDGADHNYTISYRCVGKATFEYVEDSLALVE